MKKVFYVFVFWCALSPLFSQVDLYSARQAASLAVTNSLSNRLNRQALDVAYKSARLSVGQFLPVFDFSWSEDETKKLGSTDSSAKSFSANVSQLIFDGGKTKIAWDLGKANAYYKIREFESSVNQLKAQAINKYNECVLLQEQIKIQEGLEENAQIQLNIVEEEYRLGEALETDYLEYLISFRKIQDQKRQTIRDFNNELLSLKVLLNFDNETSLVLHGFEETDDEDFYLEGKQDKLWAICQSANPSIRKLDSELYYHQKEYEFSKKTYMPQVQFKGGVNFSGSAYPLFAPRYTAKIQIDFNNNPLVPVSYSAGSGFEDGRLTDFNQGVQTTLSAKPEYFVSRQSLKISLMAKKEEASDTKRALYSQICQKISSHDSNIDLKRRLSETLELQTRRLEVSREQVESGEIKRIDYLEAMEEIAQTQIQLMKVKTSLLSDQMQLELDCALDFGGLKNVCM